MLQSLTRQHNVDWDECLLYVMQAYNGTVHASTGFTPHLLMHSQCENARLPVDMLLNEPKETLLEKDRVVIPNTWRSNELEFKGCMH